MANAIRLLLNDARGIYIPRDFIEIFDTVKWNIDLSDYQRETLASPSNEGYWDTWECILNDARYTDIEGNSYRLYQDGDLFAICYERLTDEEYLEFFGEERD